MPVAILFPPTPLTMRHPHAPSAALCIIGVDAWMPYTRSPASRPFTSLFRAGASASAYEVRRCSSVLDCARQVELPFDDQPGARSAGTRRRSVRTTQYSPYSGISRVHIVDRLCSREGMSCPVSCVYVRPRMLLFILFFSGLPSLAPEIGPDCMIIQLTTDLILNYVVR